MFGFAARNPGAAPLAFLELVLRAGCNGGSSAGAEAEHHCESYEGGVQGHAAQSDRVGDGDAFAVGKPGVERVGARSDRGACAQCAADRGEPKERRPSGCANAGPISEDRSAVVVSGETSQRQSPGGLDCDPGASRAGAGADRTDQYGAGTGEVLRRAAARLQPAERESGESERTESGTAIRAGTAAGSRRIAQRTDPRIQRRDRAVGAAELSASGAAETGEGGGDADCAHLPADLGRSASFSQEPRRGLLSGITTGTAELGAERAAAAHQQGGRSVSANAAGAGSASHSGTVWSRQRSAALGAETGRAWWEEWEETSRDRDSTKASSLAAPIVGERRSVRTAAQQQSTHAGSSLVEESS